MGRQGYSDSKKLRTGAKEEKEGGPLKTYLQDERSGSKGGTKGRSSCYKQVKTTLRVRRYVADLYTYTIAVTLNDELHFYPDDVTIPEGFTVVADYHTHPLDDPVFGPGLSGTDEKYSYDHHRTGYEADTLSRNMYRFTPEVSKYKPNEWCCGPIGDFVSHIP